MKKFLALAGMLFTLNLAACADQEDAIAGQACTTSCSSSQVCVAGQCIAQTFACGNLTCTYGQACTAINGQMSCVAGAGTAPLCATPATTVALTCWGYPAGDGTTPHTGYNATGGQQLCCPTGLDGSFTVPVGTAGSYTGRNGSTASRPFETLTTGAFGGQR